MQNTKKALEAFTIVFLPETKINFNKPDYYSFKFGDKEEFELCFEPLLFDNQMYVALYKNGELLINKVVVKQVR